MLNLTGQTYVNKHLDILIRHKCADIMQLPSYDKPLYKDTVPVPEMSEADPETSARLHVPPILQSKCLKSKHWQQNPTDLVLTEMEDAKFFNNKLVPHSELTAEHKQDTGLDLDQIGRDETNTNKNTMTEDTNQNEKNNI